MYATTARDVAEEILALALDGLLWDLERVVGSILLVTGAKLALGVLRGDDVVRDRRGSHPPLRLGRRRSGHFPSLGETPMYATTTRRLLSTVRDLARGEEGVSLAEYGLLLVLIVVICIVAIAVLGTNISKMYSMAAASI